jgi:hypothetical protein
LFVDREFSDELTSLMPIVPHGIAGANCSGFVIAVVVETNVELRCNKCGAVVGLVQTGIMEGLLGLDCAEEMCLQCGKLSTCVATNYLCDGCGKSAETEGGG